MACALILLVILRLAQLPGGPATPFMRDFLLMLFSPNSLLDRGDDSVLLYSVVLVASILRVILPVFLLGAFVFKLFRDDPLVWRKSISIEESAIDGPAVLRIRFYNATSSPLVNLTIQVFARVRSTGTPLFVRNAAFKVFQGEDLEVRDSAMWALSRPGVPFTVNVPLGTDLTARDMFDNNYLSLPGEGEIVSRDRVRLFVLASGTSLESGATFYSGCEYDLAKDLMLGHYGEVDVLYDKHPKLWKGWDRFEMNADLFVFGYSSLVSPSSVGTTLGRSVDPLAFERAKLQGWKRVWSVGSDKSSHPERTFWRADGTEFDGVTVVMGIEESERGACDGAVFPVTRGDLSVLDTRERNYRRVEVTNDVTWYGKPKDCVVYTYVPLEEATRRLESALAAGRSVNIRRGYLELSKGAFEAAGYAEKAGRPEFDKVPFPIEDLRIEIDPNLTPAQFSVHRDSYLSDPAVSPREEGPESRN